MILCIFREESLSSTPIFSLFEYNASDFFLFNRINGTCCEQVCKFFDMICLFNLYFVTVKVQLSQCNVDAL